MIDQSESLVSTDNSADLAVNGREFLQVSHATKILVDYGGGLVKFFSNSMSR